MDFINQKIDDLEKCILLLQSRAFEVKSEVTIHSSRLLELSVEIAQNNARIERIEDILVNNHNKIDHSQHENIVDEPEEKGNIKALTSNKELNETYLTDNKQPEEQEKN